MKLEKVETRQTYRTKFLHRRTWLSELVRKHGWTHGAEVGVYKGETLLWLLNTCPDLHMIGVDLWAAQPNNEGIENYTAPRLRHDYWFDRVSREAAKVGRCRIIRDWSVKAAQQVEDASLDFVFIDADHCKVAEDIEAWRPKLKDGGKLCGHDIDWKVVKADVDRLIGNYWVGPNQTWLEK